MIIDNLRRTDLFSDLPDSELKNLAATLEACDYPPGKVIMHEGGTSSTCYILVDGTVEIVKALGTPDERILAVRTVGALLGEMSLFSQDRKHTASVRPVSNVKLLQMTAADFDLLLKRQPQLTYKVVNLLSKRLEQSENVIIQELREKNKQLTQAFLELKAAQEQMIEKERLERELEIARQIQTSILPQEMPTLSGYHFGALMYPARAVGGDFFDFITLEGGRWGVVIGDVSDKGTPAALFMALTYSLLRAVARRTKTPSETLREVNEHLNEINTSGMFVTLVYGILDPVSGEFAFARAGHPHPIILGNDGIRVKFQTQPGQPLGLFDESLLDEQSTILPAGGCVIMFSDGLSESENQQGVPYDDDRLIQLINQNSRLNAQELCETVWQDVTAFTGETSQQDDFTIVAVQRLVI
jgi:phosphoserine phosphatase RsbU/P